VVSVLKFLQSDFLKNAGKLFGSSGIAQVIMLFVIPILSRLFDPAFHGDMTTFYHMVTIGVALSTLKYEQAVMVEDDRTESRNLVKLSMLINIGILVLTTAFIYIFPGFIAGFFGRTELPGWIILIPTTIFLTGAADTLAVWWNRERKYNRLSGNRLITSVSSSGYKLIHGAVAPLMSNGLVIGHFFGQIVSVIAYLPKSFARHFNVDKTSLKALAIKYKNFPLWALPSTLINTIGAALPVFIIGYFFGREMTGFFGNALKLTYIPLTAVSFAIAQVFYERLARLKEDEERFKLSNNILTFLFFLAIIPVAAMMIWGDVITPFILGKEWGVAGIMTQLIVLFYFTMYLSSPFAAAFEVYDRLDLQFIYTSIFAVVSGISLFVTLKLTGDIYLALMAFSFGGIIVRLAMMYSCFKLIGARIFGKIVGGILIIALLTTALFLARQVLS
jgi:O-antigen/teichoic acid export membrane protein